MSITSSIPFLSIIIAPNTASSNSTAWGGILPFSRLMILDLSIFLAVKEVVFSIITNVLFLA